MKLGIAVAVGVGVLLLIGYANRAPVLTPTTHGQRPTLDEMLGECEGIGDDYEQYLCEWAAYDTETNRQRKAEERDKMAELDRAEVDRAERDYEEPDYIPGYGPQGEGT